MDQEENNLCPREERNYITWRELQDIIDRLDPPQDNNNNVNNPQNNN